MNYEITIEYEMEGKNIPEDKKVLSKLLGTLGFNDHTIKAKKNTRSTRRYNALQLWTRLAGEHCENDGHTADMIIGKPTEFPITGELLRNYVSQVAGYISPGKTIKNLNTAEFAILIIILEKKFSQDLGFNLDFPSDAIK